MSVTKAGIRTRVLQMADAVGSARWSIAAGGEVDLHIGVVFMREWRRILNTNPYYRCAQRTPVSDSAGKFTISDLTTGTGDTIQSFYRVIEVVINNLPYQEMQGKDVFAALTNQTPSRMWFRQGAYLVAPDAPSVTATGIFVNYLPCRTDILSTDNIVIDFPADYEDILAYEGAASLLAKGGAEVDAAGSLKFLADEMRQEMLQDIARFSIKPWVMAFPDSPSEWAGTS